MKRLVSLYMKSTARVVALAMVFGFTLMSQGCDDSESTPEPTQNIVALAQANKDSVYARDSPHQVSRPRHYPQW